MAMMRVFPDGSLCAALRARGAAFGAVLMLLGGCEGEPVHPSQTRLSPEVTSAHVSYAFAHCSARIPAADQKRIRALVATARAEGADALIATVPRGCAPGQDAARAHAIRALLGQTVAHVDVRMPAVADPPGDLGIVRMVQVSAVQIDRAGCETPAGGCAVAGNLAAQLADPAELMYPSATARPGYHVPPPSQSAAQDSGTGSGGGMSSSGSGS